jgi:general stress protein 26
MATMGNAKTKPTPEELRTTLHDLVAHSRTIVLLTHGRDHMIAGRPMANVKTADDTTVYLTTAIDSQKIAELKQNPEVTLAIQSHAGIAMVRGEAKVSQDRALIDELWEDSWKVWFAGGKFDPAIAIVVVTPVEATFWQTDLAHGLSYLWRSVKARVAGEEMEIRPGDEEHVDLRKAQQHS